MKFSHLDGATSFPGDSAHVYEQYRNVFDYNIWTPNTVIKLCHVNWFDDYHDVVKFPDDTARNAWFDKLDGENVKLTTNMYIARADADGIKLPVPYMTAQQYNYIVVDFSRDIINTPYQKTDVQTRYHFFISSVRAEAPNTTTCTLTRDVWTDYINSTTINGLLLSRGHAPLTETTPQELLKNPRANCRDFTLPDVDYGNAASNIRKSTPFNLQNGTRYICLAATFSPGQLQAMSGMRGTNITDSDPTYSNNDGTVTGFSWGAGNICTSNVIGAGTSYNSVDNLTASNVSMYALESSKISDDYFDVLFAYYPHIMSQVTAVFVATANMMRLGGIVTVNGVEWHTVSGARTKLSDIDLTIDDFAYAREYAQITRLYLAPYAHLEVSDNIGNKTRVEIADCGHLSVRTITSLSYPILRQIAWLDGIGGDGDTAISINAITGAGITADVPNADVLKTLISHDIPTYALQRRAIDAQRAATYNVAVSQARQNATLTYENGARSANVSQANTYRSSAAAVSNTARANQRDIAIKNESNSVRSDNLTYSNTRQTADLSTSTVKINRDVSDDNTLQNKAFVEGTQTQAITNVASAIGTMAGAALVIGTGGAAAPAVTGAMAIGGAALQGYNTGIAITNSQELNATSNYVASDKAKTAIQSNTEQTQHAITQATAVTSRANTQADRVTEYSTSAATDMTATSTGTANTNAGASRNLTVDNAKRIMMNARDNTNASWRDMLNHPAQPVGAYGGDNFRQAAGLDTMTVKIVTEDNGAIAAAGDYMLRYGIASNKLYNKPSLTPCKHFTYWQSADIWTVCPLAQNEHLQTIRDIFSSGVTIWSRPEEVGGDFVHDNL
ncbi:MAG: major tail protein [Bacteriophage sp.]|nr:MAG: major tail protein [Bacteriophage sp.]